MFARMLCLFLAAAMVAAGSDSAMAQPPPKSGFFSRMKSMFRWRSPVAKRRSPPPLSTNLKTTERGVQRTQISRTPPPDLAEQIAAMHREGRTPPPRFVMDRHGRTASPPPVATIDRSDLGLPPSRPRSLRSFSPPAGEAGLGRTRGF